MDTTKPPLIYLYALAFAAQVVILEYARSSWQMGDWLFLMFK